MHVLFATRQATQALDLGPIRTFLGGLSCKGRSCEVHDGVVVVWGMVVRERMRCGVLLGGIRFGFGIRLGCVASSGRPVFQKVGLRIGGSRRIDRSSRSILQLACFFSSSIGIWGHRLGMYVLVGECAVSENAIPGYKGRVDGMQGLSSLTCLRRVMDLELFPLGCLVLLASIGSWR